MDMELLEPSGNFEAKHLKQQVYEEMKNNNINTEHLIEILQVDENSENVLNNESPTQEKEANPHDDIVS